MTVLLYGILKGMPSLQNPQALSGVGGKPVILIGQQGVSACCSELSPMDLTPDRENLKNYMNVIDAFHRDHDIIPFRYGSFLDNRDQVLKHLADNLNRYETLLNELSGCVEMGIRIIPEQGSKTDQHPPPSLPLSPVTGHDYLRQRRAKYEHTSHMTAANREILNRCCCAFDGYYRKYKTEPLTSMALRLAIGTTLLSLYFLVPRSSLEKFISAFKAFRIQESVKILLSGPWPPYNFVQ